MYTYRFAALTAFGLGCVVACGSGSTNAAAGDDDAGVFGAEAGAEDGSTTVVPDGGTDATVDADAATLPQITGLDPSFATQGRFTGGLSWSHGVADCVAKQSTGKIVLVGRNTWTTVASASEWADIVAVRFATNGAVDATWAGGKRVVSIGESLFLTGCAAAPDDKIVVTGATNLADGTTQRMIVRFTADGALDAAFGGGKGYVLEQAFGAPTGVVVQGDGKIVISTYASSGNTTTLIRYAADGVRDATFGSNGVATFSIPGGSPQTLGVALEGDGKLLALAQTTVSARAGIGIVRFTSGGLVDTATFGGGNGYVVQGSAGQLGPRRIAVDGAGRIIVEAVDGVMPTYLRFSSAGVFDTGFGTSGFAAAGGANVGLAVDPDGKIVSSRLTSTGSTLHRYLETTGAPDPAFGNNGVSSGSANGTGAWVIRLGDGRYALASGGNLQGFNASTMNVTVMTSAGANDTTFNAGGSAFTTGPSREGITGIVTTADGTIYAATSGKEFWRGSFLGKWDANGQLDTTFGTAGFREMDTTELFGLTSDANGKLLAYRGSNFTVVRLLASTGAKDTTFGSNGTVSLSIPSASLQQAFALAVDASGRPVVAGRSNDHTTLVRMTTAGGFDTTFNGAGYVQRQIPGASSSRLSSVAVRPDGKIIAAGIANGPLAVVRYLDNGTPDATFDGDGLMMLTKAGMDVGAILPQADGSTLLVGSISATTSTVVVTRITDAGALDPNFGTNGVFEDALDVAAFTGPRVSAVPQPGGGVLVATRVRGTDPTRTDIRLVRVTGAGTLDGAFGTGGRMRLSFSTGNDVALSMAKQADGKVLVGGRTWSQAGGADLLLMRLQ